MAIVIDFEPSNGVIADNDNESQINELTREVISVQYHAVGHDALNIQTQVNVYAREAFNLLKSLGVNQEQVHFLLDEVFEEKPNAVDIDVAMGNVGVTTLSLASSLCVDIYLNTRKCLSNIIKNPSRFSDVSVDIT